MRKKKFQAHGKLLLTAEYFVLDGALSLALPTKPGQSLDVQYTADDVRPEAPMLRWKSFDEKNGCWFEADFDSTHFEILRSDDPAVAARLQQLLREARKLNPTFLANHDSHLITANSRLDFPRQWGLGTSSTLVFLLSRWAGVDPFELQFRTFGGSGYDIACAGASSPVLYFLENEKPHVEACNFHPTFSNQLYFIYLGQKQDSREGIARYRQQAGQENWELRSKEDYIEKISALTRALLTATTLTDFEKLLVMHENLVSEIIGLPRAKALFFSDFWGEVKSLGAWGGDFVLATSSRSQEETRRYFNEKGYEVFLPYETLIL